MQYTYSVRCDITKTHNQDKELYGVDVSHNGEILRSSVNLFTNKKDAEKFVETCNKLDLDIIHFDDVILDLQKSRELRAVMD